MIQQVWKKQKSEINTLVYMRKQQALVRTSAEILPVAEGTMCRWLQEHMYIGD